MKQHSNPIIIQNGNVQSLEKLSLGSSEYKESWIQKLCFENPILLPFNEIEPTFGAMILICRELNKKIQVKK